MCSWYYICVVCYFVLFSFFFFNDTATTEIYTLSLHDALPIFGDRLNHCAADGFGKALARFIGRNVVRRPPEPCPGNFPALIADDGDSRALASIYSQKVAAHFVVQRTRCFLAYRFEAKIGASGGHRSAL